MFLEFYHHGGWNWNIWQDIHNTFGGEDQMSAIFHKDVKYYLVFENTLNLLFTSLWMSGGYKQILDVSKLNRRTAIIFLKRKIHSKFEALNLAFKYYYYRYRHPCIPKECARSMLLRGKNGWIYLKRGARAEETRLSRTIKPERLPHRDLGSQWHQTLHTKGASVSTSLLHSLGYGAITALRDT